MKNPGFNFEYLSKSIIYKGHYIETYSIGSGKNVVFSFPSFPHSGLCYLWFLNHYSLDKVRFVTFDLPGWIGDSEDIFAYEKFDIEEFIKIAKAVLREYEIEHFSLLGYSFGSAMSVKLASEMPERVKKMVLVSPVIDGRNIQTTKEVMLVNLVKWLHIAPVMKMYINKQWRKYCPLLAAERCPGNFLTIYTALVSRVNSCVLLDSIYTLFHQNWSVHLDKIMDKKFLIVSSREETRLFRRQAELLRRKISNGQSLYIHGQHEEFVLNPQSDVVRQVIRFLTID